MPILGRDFQAPIKEKIDYQLPKKEDQEQYPAVKLIDKDKIRPNPYNLRETVNKENLDELVNSILNSGQIVPIKVRPTKDGLYEIVYGYRRWLACKLAMLATVKCYIEDLSDDDVLLQSVIENITHEDLSVIEEAKGFEVLRTKFHYSTYKIAEMIGKSEPYVVQRCRLLSTRPVFQNLINGVDFVLSHGVLFPEPDEQTKKGLTPEESAKLISTPKKRLHPSIAYKIIGKIKDPDKQLEVAKVVTERELTQNETDKLLKELEKNDAVNLERLADIVMISHALTIDLTTGDYRRLQRIIKTNFDLKKFDNYDVKRLALDCMRMGMDIIREEKGYTVGFELGPDGKTRFKSVTKENPLPNDSAFLL